MNIAPEVYCALYVITKSEIMYKLKLCLLKLSEPWLHCSCGGFLGLLTPSGVILNGFSVYVCTMCLCTQVCKLAYMLHRTTERVILDRHSIPRNAVFGILGLEKSSLVSFFECAIYNHPRSVSFSVFRHRDWMWWVLEKEYTFNAICVLSWWYFR